ncbi:hypothetical protein N7478_012171 [Penicillium angulare]|uniref:uncharacterized protein n=1 Tax=Penicillium angulare TaxID=116970 RepID=UPI002540A512|nr:uncharacterized protein N7478_012171 [Penicillium angulare]KAJ5260566.1 hypothetical protein N7478_012171 [Penicillium angulare]
MPASSFYPAINIPQVDLWGLMFETDKEERFPHDKVIYRDAITRRSYTYAGVRDAAISFGSGLITSWSWRKGDVMTIVSPNNIDMPAIIYGTLFAGGVVSPANPSYSVDELGFQLQDNGTSAIATSKACLPAVTGAAKKIGLSFDRIIILGDERDSDGQFQHFDQLTAPSVFPKINRVRVNPLTDLAFLVYSSGTTGLPKGVMLSHHNIVANVLMVASSVGTSYSWRDDKLLGILPFYHIYGLTCLVHQPLHRGIELVVIPHFELELFLRTIEQERITFTYLAPPVLVKLATSPLGKEYDLTSLRMATSGAAPLTQSLVDTVNKRLGIKINQAYGLSETSPITHTQPWGEWYDSVGSVGKMMPNLTAKYMSPKGEEVANGESGELYLKGPSIFKGYWKNRQATEESVTADGYFRTGDVGFQDQNHNFYITDRVKELIKFNGYQVAPAELEGLLIAHPNIDDVAVIGVDMGHTEVPRAFVVLAGGIQESPDLANEIVRWMDLKVVHYKRLRGGIQFLDHIPKSAAGKILRKVLKEKVKQELVGKAKL